MTLDEAIKRAEEVAEEKENEGELLCQSEGASIGCLTCAEEHRQLAEWLKDYKRLLEQTPCEDCIDRKTLLDMTICDGIYCNECSFNTSDEYGYSVTQNGCLLEERIKKLPSVTPQMTGHWIRVDKDKCKCDRCEVISFIAMYPNGDINYCPNCGAKMAESEG